MRTFWCVNKFLCMFEEPKAYIIIQAYYCSSKIWFALAILRNSLRSVSIVLFFYCTNFIQILSMPNIWQYVACRACQNMIRNKFYDIAIKWNLLCHICSTCTVNFFICEEINWMCTHTQIEMFGWLDINFSFHGSGYASLNFPQNVLHKICRCVVS